jgi:lantibiotic modifying enzyme
MRLIISSLFVWLTSLVPSLQAEPDSKFLSIATQAGNWILSREIDDGSKAGCWPSRQDLPVEERCDLYYGNAGVLVFLNELHQITGRKEYAEAIERGIRFLDQNLPQIKLYGLYDGLAGIAFSLALQTDTQAASAVCSNAVARIIGGANKKTMEAFVGTMTTISSAVLPGLVWPYWRSASNCIGLI